jgi:F-type H+-transporting ATPase subunit delta
MNRTVPRRYAQALLMLAAERNAVDQYETELDSFLVLLKSDRAVKDLMDNPRVLPEEKKRALQNLIKNQFSPIVTNFLNLIIDKRREGLYKEIIGEYKKYADEVRNIIDAEVRSAVQLTDKDFRELKERLSQATGKNVRLKSVIDTSLIGGLVVRVGDTVIDGSVVKKLSLMKNRLQQSQFEGIGVIK